MGLKAFRHQILHGSIARRLLLRTFSIALAISVIPVLHIYSSGSSPLFAQLSTYGCASDLPDPNGDSFSSAALLRDRFLVPLWGLTDSVHCREYANLTKSVVWDLMGKKLLDYSGRTLCAGGGSSACLLAFRELGFPDARGTNRFSFFSLKQKRLVYELDYEENSFDFVLSRDLDEVSVPALLVLEMERVLKPGGIGAVLVGLGSSDSNSLIRSATPVSSMLKDSTIVHVGFINDFTLVVFKKNSQSIGFFEQSTLPADCPAISNNSPVTDFMEPLVQEKEKSMVSARKYAYLPNLIDISSRKRLIYIYIGAGEHLNSGHSNWFPPSYPVDAKAFKVYFVDHNTSVLLSYVKKPGVTFVYHPDLSGSRNTHYLSPDHDSNSDPFPGPEGFDFLAWFKETVQNADFVVLKMNSGKSELKFLAELFESGAICFVDELFLHCSEDPRNGSGTMGGACMDMFRGLRSVGVFVHQWWGI